MIIDRKRFILLSLVFFMIYGCRKPATVEAPEKQIPTLLELKDRLNSGNWGFFKDGHVEPSRALNFRYEPLEFHDGPVNYSITNAVIECAAGACTIKEHDKEVFALKFISEEVLEITKSWTIPEEVVGMHNYGGVVLEKGEKYKIIKAN